MQGVPCTPALLSGQCKTGSRGRPEGRPAPKGGLQGLAYADVKDRIRLVVILFLPEKGQPKNRLNLSKTKVKPPRRCAASFSLPDGRQE